jgi:hypothetical protein
MGGSAGAGGRYRELKIRPRRPAVYNSEPWNEPTPLWAKVFLGMIAGSIALFAVCALLSMIFTSHV